MKEQRRYQSPRVLKEVAFEPEAVLLAGSIVDDDFVLESAGQEVNNINADSGQTTEWNKSWKWE